MSKYKVGDKVKVYPKYGMLCGMHPDMDELVGDICTIKSIREAYLSGSDIYLMEENSWSWSDDVLKPFYGKHTRGGKLL